MSIDKDVRAFHLKFKHPAPEMPISTADVEESVMQFRRDRIEEEYKELMEAFESGSLAKIAAETVDLVYVLIGTLVVLGIPFMPFWRDVHRANMAKVQNPTGGKPLKPEGWLPPNPNRVLFMCRVKPYFYDPDGPEMG